MDSQTDKYAICDGQALAARGLENGIPAEAESRRSLLAEMLEDLLHPKYTPPGAPTQATTQTE